MMQDLSALRSEVVAAEAQLELARRLQLDSRTDSTETRDARLFVRESEQRLTAAHAAYLETAGTPYVSAPSPVPTPPANSAGKSTSGKKGGPKNPKGAHSPGKRRRRWS